VLAGPLSTPSMCIPRGQLRGPPVGQKCGERNIPCFIGRQTFRLFLANIPRQTPTPARGAFDAQQRTAALVSPRSFHCWPYHSGVFDYCHVRSLCGASCVPRRYMWRRPWTHRGSRRVKRIRAM
jgi:hypothetical protein